MSRPGNDEAESGAGTEAHRLLSMLCVEAIPATQAEVENIEGDLECITSREVARRLVRKSPHLKEVHEFFRKHGHHPEVQP